MKPINEQIEEIKKILHKFTVFDTEEDVAKELSTLIQKEREEAYKEFGKLFPKENTEYTVKRVGNEIFVIDPDKYLSQTKGDKR